MNETRKKILDEAQDLMQTRGYAEMTFQEIATRVGIKKPSSGKMQVIIVMRLKWV